MSDMGRKLLAGVVALISTQLAAAQGAPETTSLTIDVRVTDDSGRPVNGLTAADFTLFQDGVRVPIESVSHTQRPVSWLILLDRSSSMRTPMPNPVQLAEELVEKLGEGGFGLGSLANALPQHSALWRKDQVPVGGVQSLESDEP